MSTITLPDTDWLRSPALKRVVEALSQDAEAEAPRIVGGAVRDTLLGLPVSDIDLATPLHPNDVIDRLEAKRIKAVPTGIEHGTITAVADGKTFEITTLRRDVSTDGRRATVVFSNDWQEDAARRDFTINALYADPISGEVYDYYGGIHDLKTQRVRFIGDASARIAEDHLRILRYFRFLARFGGATIDADALAACTAAANSLMSLSRERIASELMKILALPNPILAVNLMIDNNIFTPFLPELAIDAKSRLNQLLAREINYGLQTSPVARLLTLLPLDAATADKVAMRLKFSNRARGDMAARLQYMYANDTNIRAVMYKSDFVCARDVAMMFGAGDNLPITLSKIDGWQAPVFLIKGGDVIKRGITAGPIVAKTLKVIEQRWIDEGFPDAERAEIIADQAVLAALSDIKNA